MIVLLTGIRIFATSYRLIRKFKGFTLNLEHAH